MITEYGSVPPASAYPSPLARQHAMAAQRASDQVKPDDSASGVGSWSAVAEGQGTSSQAGAAQPKSAAPAQMPAQTVWEEDSSDDDAPPPTFTMGGPAEVFAASSGPSVLQWGTAPATQAAKNLLGNQIRPECSEPPELSAATFCEAARLRTR